MDDEHGDSQPSSDLQRLRERRDFEPVECAVCDMKMDFDYYHNQSSCGEEGTYYAGQPLCEPCFSEDDAETTLRVFDADNPDGEGDYGESIFTIGACRNLTADNGGIGLWRCHRRRIDGWRSSVEVDPPEGWSMFHTDAALVHSADEKDLERFDLYLRKALIAKGMRMIRATSLTTNVFCVGVDYFVEKKNLRQAEAVAKKLADAFRDPVRFNMTAITGKNPEDADFGDYLLGAIGAVTLGRGGSR